MNFEMDDFILDCKNGDFEEVSRKWGSFTTHQREQVLKNKDKIGDALYLASAGGHLEIVKFLIEKKANINTHLGGWTPLHIACYEGHFDVAKCLIDKNSKIESDNNGTPSPLYLASEKGHLEIVKYLIENKSHVEACRKNGITPLLIACEQGHVEIVRFLVRSKADVENSRHDGVSPLFNASQSGHLEIVKFLIENKSNIEASTNNKYTPLMVACYNGNKDIVQFLLSKNADVNCLSQSKSTPMDCAQRGKQDSKLPNSEVIYQDIIKLLESPSLPSTPKKPKKLKFLSDLIGKKRLSAKDCNPKIMDTFLQTFFDSINIPEASEKQQYIQTFMNQGFTTNELLMTLTMEDLETLKIEKLGHRKLIKVAIDKLVKIDEIATETYLQKPGDQFLSMIKDAPTKIEATSVIDCLENFAKNQNLPNGIITQLKSKIITLGLPLALLWVYTVPSWIYKEVNESLRKDSQMMQQVSPFIVALVNSGSSLNSSYFFSGILYRRTFLTQNQIALYKEGSTFVWPAFTSTSSSFLKHKKFGEVLFLINVPDKYKQFAIKIEKISKYPLEREVLLLPCLGYRVKKVTKEKKDIDFDCVDTIIELELVWSCLI